MTRFELVRIVSDRNTLMTRFDELKNMLLSRKYPKNIVNSAIERASKKLLKRIYQLSFDLSLKKNTLIFEINFLKIKI